MGFVDLLWPNLVCSSILSRSVVLFLMSIDMDCCFGSVVNCRLPDSNPCRILGFTLVCWDIHFGSGFSDLNLCFIAYTFLCSDLDVLDVMSLLL